MRAALLLCLLALDASAQGRLYDRACGVSSRRSSRGGVACASYVPAFFEFMSAGTTAGQTSPCDGATPAGVAGEVLTFTRASAAECYANNGQTLTQVSTGQPRVSSGDVTSAALGLWVEAAATNSLLYGRDWSNVAWTPTTMTCAKTATGMRGDANSASTCTATGASATVLQTVTIASASRATSLHIKRRTGTGVVEVTRDNGGTWSAITASLSSTLWKRVVPSETPGCGGGNCIVVAAMTATAANPIIGIRITTSGDAVDLDFAQDEAGPVATSPIFVEGTAQTRVAEVAYATLPVAANTTGVYSMAATMTVGSPATANWYGVFLSTADADPYVIAYNTTSGSTFRCETYNATAADARRAAIGSFSDKRISCYNDGANTFGYYDGAAIATVTAGTKSASLAKRLYLGNSAAGTTAINGIIKKVCLDPSPTRCR